MGLFEELSQTFPSEVIEPYGEVLVVPCKSFKNEWRSQLEAEGVQIYTNSFMGQVCFFLRKKRRNQAVLEEAGRNEAEPKPSIEEEVVKLIRQGLGFNEIQQRLGLTRTQLMGRISALSRKGVLASVGWTPKRRMRKPSTREEKNEPASNLNVRELLEASLKLLESHPKVAKFLLQKAVEVSP